MEKGKEVVKKKGTAVATTPSELIRIAVEANADVEKLEKLMDLQMRWEANEAKKAYIQAMADFKENPPEIFRDKAVEYKAVKYKHASLSNVTQSINKELSKHGLSASWQTAQNGAVSVTCIITHTMGHSERTTLSAPSDTSGSKNGIQAIGSTITYLQRYSILALTGLAVSDQDDDGQSADVEYISDEQRSTILDYVDNLPVDRKAFLSHMKIESIEKMPKAKYNQAIVLLEQKSSQKKKNFKVVEKEAIDLDGEGK